jgi:hypothetical protein
VACGNIFDIIHGRSEYASLKDFVQRHPAFTAFRAEQEKITDRARPCLMMDHPEAFRRIYKMGQCRPAKNMAPGYLDGEIAQALDTVAEEWRRHVPYLAPLPADLEAAEASARLMNSAMAGASATG